MAQKSLRSEGSTAGSSPERSYSKVRGIATVLRGITQSKENRIKITEEGEESVNDSGEKEAIPTTQIFPGSDIRVLESEGVVDAKSRKFFSRTRNAAGNLRSEGEIVWNALGDDSRASLKDEPLRKSKPNVRTTNPSYCPQLTRRRSVAFPTLRTASFLIAMLRKQRKLAREWWEIGVQRANNLWDFFCVAKRKRKALPLPSPLVSPPKRMRHVLSAQTFLRAKVANKQIRTRRTGRKQRASTKYAL